MQQLKLKGTLELLSSVMEQLCYERATDLLRSCFMRKKIEMRWFDLNETHILVSNQWDEQRCCSTI